MFTLSMMCSYISGDLNRAIDLQEELEFFNFDLIEGTIYEVMFYFYQCLILLDQFPICQDELTKGLFLLKLLI